MKICFPVREISGLESEVYGHFGSAPAFMLVDSESGAITVVDNADRHHKHGMCNPVAALQGQKVDVAVVGGIGGGALMKLNGAGIRVYRAEGRSVSDNLELFNEGRLSQFMPGHVCAGHAGGCSH